MQYKSRLRRNILIALTLTLVSAGVVFATAGAQAATQSRPEAAIFDLPAAQEEPAQPRTIEPEIQRIPSAGEASTSVPKTSKARALANGEPLPTAPKRAEDAIPDDLVLLDTFIATAYCLTGTTSTGTYTTVGRTLAVNPGIIPYGTHVWLYLEDGTFVGDYYAEDTGSNMMEHPYVVDIYMGEDSYDACINWGAQRVLIYVESE